MLKSTQWIFLCLFSLLLTSCGKQVCVMGMGECAAPDKPITAARVTVAADTDVIYASSNVSGPHAAVLTISGGNPNYSVSITSGNTNIAYFLNGTTQTSSLSGVTSKVTLYAQSTLGAETVLTVSVYDSSNPSKPGSFFITVKP